MENEVKMRNRQPGWSKSMLPHNVYMSVLYIVRDYPRSMALRDAIINGTPPQSVGRSAGTVSAPTEAKAIRLTELQDKCSAVESALKAIPEEYRDGVFNNIVYGFRYPDMAHRNTWSKWRTRFLYHTARNLHLL